MTSEQQRELTINATDVQTVLSAGIHREVLSFLYHRSSGASVEEVACRLACSPADAQASLAELEQRGFLARSDGPEARFSLVAGRMRVEPADNDRIAAVEAYINELRKDMMAAVTSGAKEQRVFMFNSLLRIRSEKASQFVQQVEDLIQQYGAAEEGNDEIEFYVTGAIFPKP